jgi:hypothetical protein
LGIDDIHGTVEVANQRYQALIFSLTEQVGVSVRAIWRLVQQHVGECFLCCHTLEAKVIQTIVDNGGSVMPRDACAVEVKELLAGEKCGID